MRDAPVPDQRAESRVDRTDPTRWVTEEVLRRPGMRQSKSCRRIEVRGVDLLEFADGRIPRKDSFWKILE